MKTPVTGNAIRIDADRIVIDEGDAICTYSREYYRLALEPATKLVYGLHAVAVPVYTVRTKRKQPHETAAKQNTLVLFYRKRRHPAMEKVKLPREVAEAIDALRKEVSISTILWGASRGTSESRPWKVLFEFVSEDDNIFKLADAIRYGYDIEPEPITVTITPEMQEKAKKYFADKEAECKEAEKEGFTGTVRQIGSEVYGARYILKVLGITIPGVNA